MLLLNFFISLGIATTTFKGTTLTIADESTIGSNIVSQYNTATEVIITSNSQTSIEDQAFQGFSSLETLSITANQISIQANSFSGCAKLISVNLDSPTLNIQPGAFSSSSSVIISYRGSSFYSGMTSFISSHIKGFNIDVTGDCTFGLAAASNSYVEEIRIKAATVSFVQDCFKNAKGINIVQIYATQSITFGLESFLDAEVGEIECYAGNQISLVQDCFNNVHNISVVNLTSGGSITLGLTCFLNSAIEDVFLKASQDITVVQDAMKNVKNFNRLIIETNGNFQASLESFINSTVHEIYINCGKSATFVQDSFKNTPDLRNLTVIATESINFQITSFMDSNINSMELYTNGSVTFVEDSFKNTKNLTYFVIHAMSKIDFQLSSFMNSNVNRIDLYTNGEVNFVQDAFKNCQNLEYVHIHSASDVTFGLDAFYNSQIHELDIQWYDSESSAVLLSEPSTIKFASGSFRNCKDLSSVAISTKGNVNIQSNSFQDSSNLYELNIHADGKATIGSQAFAGCSSLHDPSIDASEKDISGDAFGEKEKGHGSSSDNDDDDDNHYNAKTLGDFEIKSVYLGTSPNIIYNFHPVVSFFRKARKTFGHLVPAPELIHSAIWVGKENPTDDSVGAIFVYGRYFNKLNRQEYIAKDGAKAYVMSLREFKRKYPSIDPIKLNPCKKLNLFKFIDEIMKSGKWGVKDYNWPTNNCQHFTAKMIDILGATRENISNDDWMDLPKPVLESLRNNERKEK